MLSRFRRHLASAGIVTALLLTLSTGVGEAAPPKLIPFGQLSTGGLPVGVAVDQASSDVYVATFSNQSFSGPGHVEKFDAAGKLLPPSPFGEGINTGTAVNPTNGDVYVINASAESIETYDPSTGAPLSSFTVPLGGAFAALVGIATDSAGDVYTPSAPNNEILEYSPSGTLLNTFTGSGAGALKEPTDVAVDASGNLWVADQGDNRIEELSSTGAFLGEIKSEGVHAVALDGHGDIFAIVRNSTDFCGSLRPPCSHLVEYSAAGAQLTDVGAGDFGIAEGIELPSTVAVNEADGQVYVTDSGKQLVWVFGPPVAPAVERELSSEVGTSEAKLGALVNPGGIETSYRFEYGTTTAYGQTAPFPEGSVGEGVTSRTVWAAASGLAPGTTYHYRVVATNELGTAVGPDQTFTTETAAQVACPNEQLRGGFSARLPDCRAYELVTPPTKTSVQFEQGGVVGGDGNRISFHTQEPLPSASAGGDFYLATRGTGGWSSEDLIPLRSYTAVGCSEESGEVPARAYSVDLSKSVVSVGDGNRASTRAGATGACNAEGVETVSGEPVGYENLLLRDNTTGSYSLINALPPGVTPADAHFQGASSDLGHVVFSEHAPLTAGAPLGTNDLYEWSGGGLRLVSVLPDGTPVGGSLPEARDGLNGGHPVSADGSRVVFTADDDLYVRLDGSRTVQLDASQAGGVGGGGTFWTANANGSRMFFSDEATAGLTADTVPGSGANLYEYDVASGVLTDLTAAGKAGLRRVVAISEDGSYVYFVAEGSLASGATADQRNLYLSHGGSITFIARLGGGDSLSAAQASPDGAWLAFASHNSLTGYDNTEPDGASAEEVFLYNATSNRLACASCDPSGEAPVAGGGATIQARTITVRYLPDGGRLFFDTRDPLVPSDTNNQSDVYEYEGGQPQLISSGTSSQETVFLGASESGGDVFFLTRQQLVAQDTEEEGRVIYDARVDGGFPAVSAPPPCTTADACRTPVSPQPAIYGAPSSQTFSGAGNLASPGEVKSKQAKPKKKPTKPKQRSKKVCKRTSKHKHARCAARSGNRRAKTGSHKGGK